MRELRHRRSCRLAMSIPIRVFGTDYKGKDFFEDTTTLVVNQHGAKIRLVRQLVPEQEILLVSRSTDKEALFRVVSKVTGPDANCTYWGVECLAPEKNIWGIQFPELHATDQVSVRLMIQCPVCGTRDVLYLDEPTVQSLESTGGVTRGCLVCRTEGLWKPIPYREV